MVVVFLINILACASTHQTNLPSVPKQKFGFRFASIPECLLVTDVEPGYGAHQAGLRNGDCIESVNGYEGDAAKSVLHDVSIPEVTIHLRSALSFSTTELIVQRGVYSVKDEQDSDKRHPIVLAASKGELDSMSALFVEEDIPFSDIQRSTALLKRYFSDRHYVWLKDLSSIEDDNPWLSAMLVQQFGELQDWKSVVTVFEKQPSNVQMFWIRWSPQTIRFVVLALWETGSQQSAIQLLRLIQPWMLNTGMEQTVGLVGIGNVYPLEIKRNPTAAGLTASTIDDAGWSLDAHQWTVLNFWATWCHPCQKELPHLSKWAVSHPEVEILTVNMNDNPTAVEVTETLHKWGVEPIDNWSNSMDKQLGGQFQIDSLPTVVLMDGSGVEHLRVEGYLPTITERIVEAIEHNHSTEQIANYRGLTGVDWIQMPSVQDLVWSGDRWWILTDKLSSDPDLQVLIHGAEQQFASNNDNSKRMFANESNVLILDERHSTCRLFADGREIWFHTLPSRLLDAVWLGEHLVMALEDRLVVLSSHGEILYTSHVSVQNLHVQSLQDGSLGVQMTWNGRQYMLNGNNGVYHLNPDFDTISMPSCVQSMKRESNGVYVQLKDGYNNTLIVTDLDEQPIGLLSSSNDFRTVFNGQSDVVWVVFPNHGLLRMSLDSPPDHRK